VSLLQVRVLTRILPILLEESDDDFTNALFWRNKLPPHRMSTESQQAVIRAAIAAGNPPDASPTARTPAPAEPLHPEELVIDPEYESRLPVFVCDVLSLRCPAASLRLPPVSLLRIPLGTQLIHSIMFLLFTPGFTVDATQFDLWHDQVDRQKAVTEAAAANQSPRAADAEVKSPQPVATPATEATESEDEIDTNESVDENEDEEELLTGDPLTTSVWSSLLWWALVRLGTPFPALC
jgi:hypothetical protein